MVTALPMKILHLAPKYRRQIIYKQISADIGQIIRTLCARKGIEIIKAAALPDHIHLYVAIPPKYSVSEIVGYLKGKSSLRQLIKPPPEGGSQ